MCADCIKVMPKANHRPQRIVDQKFTYKPIKKRIIVKDALKTIIVEREGEMPCVAEEQEM